MTMTPDDVIKAAASVARDAAEGRLSPAALAGAGSGRVPRAVRHRRWPR